MNQESLISVSFSYFPVIEFRGRNFLRGGDCDDPDPKIDNLLVNSGLISKNLKF